ncbi:hypothetical protein ACLOJK_003253 [Asimina triloba]
MGGMEDPSFIHQCEVMNSLDPYTTQQIAAALGEDFQHSLSSDSSYSYPSFSCSTIEASNSLIERPAKQLRTSPSSWNSCTTDVSIPDAASPPKMLSFGSQNPSTIHNQQFYGGLVDGHIKPKDEAASSITSALPREMLISQGSLMNQSYLSKSGNGSKRVSVPSTPARPPSHTQDHIIAERKRREKLSQRFIALSAIVPGLKKMDKASVLGDAIKYVKQLQDRVKALEEQAVKKTVESVVFVKKSQLSVDDDLSSSDDSFDGRAGDPLPEIEARVCERNVLIRIHCEKRKGTLVKALAEIEKLHLTVINSNVMPFGNSAVDITLSAQMEDVFCMTTKDLVRHLRAAFSKIM